MFFTLISVGYVEKKIIFLYTTVWFRVWGFLLLEIVFYWVTESPLIIVGSLDKKEIYGLLDLLVFSLAVLLCDGGGNLQLSFCNILPPQLPANSIAIKGLQ